MRAPVLAIGDGALGFWNALLPKSAHPGAKRAPTEIWGAEDKEHTLAAVKAFETAYGAKFPKAAAKITDDADQMLAFYDYPAGHWVHLRTPSRPLWPADKLAALRTGQRLVTEVPASQPSRRAFIDITPITTPADAQARQEGWKRTDHARAFRLQHWDYDADRIDGYDYDRGAVMIRAAAAAGEAELLTTLQAWQLRPDQFLYPLADQRPKVVRPDPKLKNSIHRY